MNKKTLALTVLALTTLISCGTRDSGGGAGNSGPDYTTDPAVTADETSLSCELGDMRRWVDANMRDYYLFYDQVPVLNLSDYTDLDLLIKDLRVAPNDKFSFIADAATSSAQFEQGVFFGFGQRIVVTQEGRVRFTQVHEGSPFAEAGVKRGDYLLTINGSTPFNATDAEKKQFFGIDPSPATLTYTIENESNQINSYTLTSTDYTVATVLDARVFDQGSQRIGYLAFDSFLETSRAELDTAFAEFQVQNINEMILDLRYNSGGRIDVAKKLASLIAGTAVTNQTFTTLALNDKYSQFNESINYSNESNALNLTRLVVLTTDSSCSASELIINGLRPFIEVIVIGNPTCGKPYGTLARESCGKSMSALQFELQNANGVGGYYNGISADCAATDDLNHAIGDLQEGMLEAGISYLTSAQCQTPRNKRQTRHPWPAPQPSYNLLDKSLNEKISQITRQ